MASQGRDGRWWRHLVLPLLEAESGLYRADALYPHLGQEMARCDCDGTPFSMLLFSGRPASGGRLKARSVQAATTLLVTTARQQDVPARLSGRTFALLLPGIVAPMAAKLRRVLELDLRLAAADTGDRWHVTCLSYPTHRNELRRLVADRRVHPSASAHRVRPHAA